MNPDENNENTGAPQGGASGGESQAQREPSVQDSSMQSPEPIGGVKPPQQPSAGQQAPASHKEGGGNSVPQAKVMPDIDKSGGGGEKKSPTGAIIGSIIIVVIIVVGGFYLWGQNISEESEEGADTTVVDDTTVEELGTQSSSDEIEAIEEDLESTDFTGLEDDLSNIEEELSL